MPLDSATIDRIVAGVLTQLGGGGSRLGDKVTTEVRRHGDVARGEGRGAREVELAERIITASLVAELPDDVGGVAVGAKAIVTPAAWDVLKERSVTVQRRSARPVGTTPRSADVKSQISDLKSPDRTLNAQPSTRLGLLIIVHHTDAVARLWDDLQSNWRREFLGCPDDAAKLASAELSRGGTSQVVIVAEQTHRAACLANRHEAVKAVAIRDIADVQATKTQLRANVWCLSPKDKSWFELRRLFTSLDHRP